MVAVGRRWCGVVVVPRLAVDPKAYSFFLKICMIDDKPWI